MLTVGSLFSGIGGIDLGLTKTGGFKTSWFCESDPHCRRVIAKHWPGAPCYPDVRDLRGQDVEWVDVLVGGSPCQDISNAGRRAGLDGARSGLWSEYARLVGELRPNYVLLENVAALQVRGLRRVLGDLHACGYDAEWDCLPASAFGAPHRRDRLWLIGYLPDTSRQRLQARSEQAPQYPTRFPWWKTEPPIRRVADGVPNGVDRLRALGNAAVPQIAYWLGQRILAYEGL